MQTPKNSARSYIEDFLAWCELERHNSPRWVDFKRFVLEEFRRFTAGQKARRVEQWEPKHLSGYLNHRRKTAEDRPETLNRRAVIIRHFCRWCLKTRRVKACPMAEVEIKPPRKEERPLPDWDTMLALIGSIQEEDRREAAVVLAHTGCRRSEVILARWEDVDWEEGVLRIPAGHAKSHKPRAVPLPAPALQVLQDRRSRFPRSRGPWLDAKGKTMIHPDTLTDTWRNCADRAGHMETRLHDLRAAFGVRSLQLGADIVTVQNVYGHAQLETTRRYLRCNADSAVSMKSIWDKAGE